MPAVPLLTDAELSALVDARAILLDVPNRSSPDEYDAGQVDALARVAEWAIFCALLGVRRFQDVPDEVLHARKPLEAVTEP